MGAAPTHRSPRAQLSHGGCLVVCILLFLFDLVAADAMPQSLELAVVQHGQPAHLNRELLLGQAQETADHFAIRSAPADDDSPWAGHYLSIAAIADMPPLVPGDFRIRVKLALVKLHTQPWPIVLSTRIGSHWCDLAFESGRVTVKGVWLDATRYDQMETAHSVPVTLDGTPFVLEFARHNGIVRITLDGRLLQQFWIEPGEGELAICVERNHLPRTTAPPDVQAELRWYDWHVTGTSKGSSEARRRWNKLVGNKLFMKRVGNAYAYVEDDPALPNVLIIGDSISIYCTDPVRRLLAGRADVFRTPMGPGKAETLFASLDEFLTQHHWDVIHFNTGLHDFARKQGTAEDLEQYRGNLEKIVAKLQATGARLIWASTTPVPEQVPQSASSDELARKYNAVAKQIMDARQIPIDDLYSAMKPVHDRYWLKPNNIHFNEAGSAFLGRIVTNAILQELDRRPGP